MIVINICKRCGWDFASRPPFVHAACPRCKSRLWNVTRKNRPTWLKLSNAARKQNEDKRLYGFHDLQVGQSERWYFKDEEFNARRVRALAAYEKRTGRKYVWDEHHKTMTRIK